MDKKVNPDTRAHPSSICMKCRKPVTLSWGTDNKPGWRHKKGGCMLNANHHDMMTHNLAKELLISFLNKGYILEVVQKCPNSAPRIYQLSDEQEAVSEWRFGKTLARFDIGCCGDTDPSKEFAIEICHTHQTTNLAPREQIDWIELNASEVLDALDQFAIERTITVRNIRPQCSDPSCVSCKTFEKLLLDIGIMKIEYSFFKKRKNEEKRWLLVFTDPYGLSTDEEKDNSVIIPQSSLWAELVTRGRCAYCKRKHVISIGNPYCNPCAKKMAIASKDGGITCVFGDLFESDTIGKIGDYSLPEFLNKIFSGSQVLSSDDIKIRTVKKVKNVFIATSTLHQLYIQWSGETKVSIKRVALILEGSFKDVTAYQKQVTIGGSGYWGFHILETAWPNVKIANKICFRKIDGTPDFRIGIIPLDEYVSKEK